MCDKYKSGHNAYEAVKNTLERYFSDRWEKSSQKYHESGNSSWHGAFTQFMEDILDELEDKEYDISWLEKENKKLKEKLDWDEWLSFRNIGKAGGK